MTINLLVVQRKFRRQVFKNHNSSVVALGISEYHYTSSSNCSWISV